MILIDYSQIALGNVFQFQNDLKKNSADTEVATNLIRHAVISGLKYYKKKFSREYGEVVIACDDIHYWRKDVFPYYKACRQTTRNKSDLDWKLIFDTVSQIRDDIMNHFPYKVIHVAGTEADDIIATLCMWTQTNGLIDHGMFEEKQKVLIISSDGDFKQLHKYDNVNQYSPKEKKKIVCSDPESYLKQHIASGDSGDGIPNTLSADNVLATDGLRQTKMMAARLEEFVSIGRDACRNDQEKTNWDRNNRLINLELIPVDKQQQIVEMYTKYNTTADKMSIFNYLLKHRCSLLLKELDDF